MDLQPRLSRLGDGLSEYCFSNLFLFRTVHRYRVIQGRKMFVQGQTYDGFSFLMPLFDPVDVDTDFLVDMIRPFDFYFPISRSVRSHFDAHVFDAGYCRDDSDYVFSAEKLKAYCGSALEEKRNLMDRFLKTHVVESFSYDDGRKKDAVEILFDWQAGSRKSVRETDFMPCREALDHLERLGLQGCIYYADDEPAGFLLAREVIPGMCVFHFAKGKRKFSGLYPLMFSQFARLHEGVFRYYNFEQDLGRLNFRKIKMSYVPDALLKKYRVFPKKEMDKFQLPGRM